ncbi:serine dehydratase subunit alpha family protein [Youngiibacter multivorans]|nr:L-serine ammonia-lyase, iron-sulfur-dependent, subunit alpha [Youngiibacter multivorans]
MILALGCTEPISIAYAASKARDVLGVFPEKINVTCSGNIVKNVKGVTVPNSGGLKGIDIAAVLGVVAGNSKLELEVLSNIEADDISKANKLIEEGFFSFNLNENVENLYIKATVYSNNHSAEVTILNQHTFISEIKYDNEIIYRNNSIDYGNRTIDKSTLNVKDILEFADSVKLSEIEELIQKQIKYNSNIANEGINNCYGASVGKTLIDLFGNSIEVRAKAKAAAGSDARMGGCPLPVVIISGSGNQGMTVSIPVIEYAHEYNVDTEKLLRSLVVANLLAIHIKRFIGRLSAFCGAVSAACGAGAAITYMSGGDFEKVSMTITNILANVSGIICDGAKPSCAAKIASAVDAAILAHNMSMRGLTFQSGDGIVKDNIEETIQSIGHVARVGMKDTDKEILNIMIGKVSLGESSIGYFNYDDNLISSCN